MKALKILIILLAITGSTVWSFQKKVVEVKNGKLSIEVENIFSTPCSQPIEYSIGNVDERFGMAREDFQKIVMDSEKIWENAMGMNIFEYNPDGLVKVNLIYDERQASSDESLKLEKELAALNSSANVLNKNYDDLKISYEKKSKEYEENLAQYEKNLKKYNNKVDDWNKSDKSSQSEYEELKDDKKDLEEEYKKLDKERKDLNSQSEKINGAVKKENKLVNNYNSKVNTYKDKYGATREFEKGVYSADIINIYQYQTEEDLRLTLSHEFGHARGIDHVENPLSLMYYLMADQDMDNPTLTNEDIREMKNVCEIL
ncbi:MAG: hypothetical protein COU40_03720 [Candidatus Moranbacteria bacterium CG10_big_fil_rev_8_21_14_0_10_35_21]|nr:MAG: hypothetical protein COU40_03720 [Candidatus Moranbacteria bacterium CG10_big_fil_rev_8_21_14_0_10_35_21]PJA88801.1 MAG: hypothetical protein CO139_01355 [Candidatus Moranbacteria bacterium CG_4_9_14_3_um_filter_36_9]